MAVWKWVDDHVWDLARWLLPPSAVGGAVTYVLTSAKRYRERVILDELESASQPQSVSLLRNGFIKLLLSDVQASPTRFQETRNKWRVLVLRRLPSEEKIRDTLRVLKTSGLVRFVGEDAWEISPHK